MFKPRFSQLGIINYEGGKMGISAVPGSGKTHTLSYLASKLIAEGFITDNQEILIVTLVNSAVNNFSTRIEGFLRDRGLLPGMGYRVRTLHGLAHDIIKERPGLIGLSEKFIIMDEREREQLIKDLTLNYMRENPDFVQNYMIPSLSINNIKIKKDWLNLLQDIGSSFISKAKDHQLDPETLSSKILANNINDPLIMFGHVIYTEYQRLLIYRNSLDFDDLIRYAYKALLLDPEFLERLSYKWLYILEDEAQDSSQMQEDILRTLSAKNGNWIRVGDPNQAIYETFTTANPKLLLDFIEEPETSSQQLPNSGRSTVSIINLANQLIKWTRNDHPILELREALKLPYISPAPPGDPQPNPIDTQYSVYICKQKVSPDEENEMIVNSLKRWLPDNINKTVAILVPRNERGAKIVELLQQNDINYIELLKSSISTRETAKLLADILRYLNEPASQGKLATLYQSISTINPGTTNDMTNDVCATIRKCKYLEEYIWPKQNVDWIENLIDVETSGEIVTELIQFRLLIQKWHEAMVLPVDQLIITIAQDLFSESIDLALAHKLSVAMKHLSDNNSELSFHQLTEELELIASNRSRFLGFSDEDIGFDPDQHPGEVVVSTIHKAKGMEWDRVYLASVNNYDFPSADDNDNFIGEKWFIRENLNLQAEAIDKLNKLAQDDLIGLKIDYGLATYDSRLEYAKERLRLLYVGITRARKELMISWNTGKPNTKMECVPARAIVALSSYMEQLY